MDILELIKEFIKPELIIIVPVLYIFGMGLKSSIHFCSKYIPLILGAVSTALVTLYLIATVNITTGKDIALLIFTSLTQGILLAGASVYINQIYKQAKK